MFVPALGAVQLPAGLPGATTTTGSWETEADLHLHVQMGFLPLLPLLGLDPFLFL